MRICVHSIAVNEPVTLPAATLIAVRDRVGAPPECLMLRRHGTMSFADAWVFPGGRVDEGDCALARRLAGESEIGDIDDLSARIAAIRETIEEAGLVVAIDPVPDQETLAALRAALRAGGDFATLLDEAGLSLRPERLVPFARWSPPLHVPRRFDTRFYLAEITDAREVSADGRESVDVAWVGAAEMLARGEAGGAKLVFPTRANLLRLAAYGDYAALAAAAGAMPVRLIVTQAERGDGWVRLTVPEGHGYPAFSMVERFG